MQRTPWIERKFNFDFPEGWIYNIMERLRGTSVRLKNISEQLNHNQLTRKKGKAWSIQEHIGHLLDLEALHEGRFDDFLERKKVLRAADMSNAKTEAAHHNNADITRLLNDFEQSRNCFISRLKALDDDTQRFQSLHPRLQIMMRPVDMAYFTSEHDDHHLASIRMLIENTK